MNRLDWGRGEVIEGTGKRGFKLMLRRVREQEQGRQGEDIVSWAQSSWGAASQSRAEG